MKGMYSCICSLACSERYTRSDRSRCWSKRITSVRYCYFVLGFNPRLVLITLVLGECGTSSAGALFELLPTKTAINITAWSVSNEPQELSRL